MILFIKNIFSLFIFFFLKIFFNRAYNKDNKNILFFNSEKIGDLIISSLILENDEIFPDNLKIYFLIKEKYYTLFENYSGRIKIITYNYSKYKWFLLYRFFLLKRLRKLELNEMYNLSPARGMLNDELSILCGANKIYGMDSKRKYIKSFAGKIMDSHYNEILFKNIKNEYEKFEQLVGKFGEGRRKFIFNNNKVFKLSGSNYFMENKNVNGNDYILISPLSSDSKKMWSTENFKKLSNELSNNYKIILTGTQEKKNILEKIRQKNENIFVDTSSLKDLPDIINKCRLFIGGDSGLTHIALKLGLPLLAIINGGYYNKYFPYKVENIKNNFIFHYMDCFGCELDCIYERKYCIENITYEEVIKKVNQILDNIN